MLCIVVWALTLWGTRQQKLGNVMGELMRHQPSLRTTGSFTCLKKIAMGPGASFKKAPAPVVEYIRNVMKFVDPILSNNSIGDRCREFVTLRGLVTYFGTSQPPSPLSCHTSYQVKIRDSCIRSLLLLTFLFSFHFLPLGSGCVLQVNLEFGARTTRAKARVGLSSNRADYLTKIKQISKIT